MNTTKRVKRIRDQIDEIAQDADIKLGMKRVQIKELEAEERGLYDDATRAYNDAVRGVEGAPAAR